MGGCWGGVLSRGSGVQRYLKEVVWWVDMSGAEAGNGAVGVVLLVTMHTRFKTTVKQPCT